MIQHIEKTGNKRFDRRRFRMQGPKEAEAYQRTFPDPRVPGKPQTQVPVPVAYHWETVQIDKAAWAEDLIFEPNEQAALAPPPKMPAPDVLDRYRKEIGRLEGLLRELGQAAIPDESPEAAKEYIARFVADALNPEFPMTADLDASEERQAYAKQLGELGAADLRTAAGELEITFNAKTTMTQLKKLILDKKFPPKPETKPAPTAATPAAAVK